MWGKHIHMGKHLNKWGIWMKDIGEYETNIGKLWQNYTVSSECLNHGENQWEKKTATTQTKHGGMSTRCSNGTIWTSTNTISTSMLNFTVPICFLRGCYPSVIYRIAMESLHFKQENHRYMDHFP